MNTVRAFAICVFTALTAGTTTAVAQTQPILIGVPTGLSGANSTVAPAVVQSSKLAVEQINEAGGILGRQVELAIADDGSGAVGAQRAFDNLIFNQRVDVLISMETSAARNAGLPAVNKGDVPYIYTSLYEGGSCDPHLFVAGAVPNQLVNPVVDFLMGDKGAQTFFLVGSDYAFGRGMLGAARAYVENKGGKIVGEEYQPMNATDWTSTVSSIRRANPDAILMATAGGAPNVTLQRQYKAAGMEAPVGNLSVDQLTAQKMGEDAVGVYISASYLTSVDNEANRKFLQAMREKFGDEMRTPNALSEPQYDAIYLYKAAVEKSGTTDTGPVLKALSTVSFDGPRGRVQMDDQHHTELTMRLGALQADGSVKVLKSFEDVSPGKQCPDLGN